MQIVNFDEFVKLPVGTIFSYYGYGDTDGIVRGLYRKGASIYSEDCTKPTDYFEESILADEINPISFTQMEFAIGGVGRWGEFEWNQKYLIYNKDDVDKMINLMRGIDEN